MTYRSACKHSIIGWVITIVFQFSCSVVSDSLRPMNRNTPGLHVHHQLLESTQTHVPRVSDAIQPSHPLSSPFPPAFNLCGQSIGASTSASVLPMNIQGCFPLGLTRLIFLQSKTLSRVFSNTTVQKHQFFGTQPSLLVQLSHPYMTTGKTIALTIWTFIDKVMSLVFNMLSRLVIAFLPKSKHLLISWLQSLSTVILEPKKIWNQSILLGEISITSDIQMTPPLWQKMKKN